MSVSNSTAQYGAVAKTFHWLTALGIAAVIPLGIIANDMPYDTAEQLADKAWLFSLHKTVGVTLFFIALARILWAISQPKPAPLHPDRRAETLLAEIVHWLLYGSLVLVPLSGWVHHAATEGFAPIWWPFGQNLPLVPESVPLSETAAGLHIVFERVLILSLFLHIAGAIKHALIDKDDTLARMLPGRRVTSAPKSQTHRKLLPPVLAGIVWAAAIGVGSVLGVYHKGTAIAAEAPALQQVESDWTVTDGTLGITVRQMGSEVTGRFADWTADITFDETVASGVSGSVLWCFRVGRCRNRDHVTHARVRHATGDGAGLFCQQRIPDSAVHGGPCGARYGLFGRGCPYPARGRTTGVPALRSDFGRGGRPC